MKIKPLGLLAWSLLWAFNAQLFTAHAQGTAFTYQGTLNVAAGPANGSYDLQFGLWNAATGPSQLGGTVTSGATPVSNGQFIVTLDFGSQFQYPGPNLWLEIAVRTNGAASFTTLAPRQPLSPTPYAIYSANAGTALAATVAGSANSVSAANISGVIPLAQLPGSVVTNGAGSVSLSGAFTGNGGGLTNLNGTNLTAGSVGRTQLAGGTVAAPVSVSGTNQAVTPNTSYLALNSNSTAFDLPLAASLGDIVQITGAGMGGWTALEFSQGGTIWQQTAAGAGSFNGWNSVASSADGTHLAAATYQIFTSTNSGLTWTPSITPSGNWSAVASSTNGTRLVAAGSYWGIITSTNGGATWTHTSAPIGPPWYNVASSADGTHLVAIQNGGGIYTSPDGGVTWTPTSAPSLYWTSVASSADGTHLVAVNQNEFDSIYTSMDSGATWTQNGLASVFDTFDSVASSADGTHLVVASGNFNIYTSTNFGTNWTLTVLTQTVTQGISVASSSDGTNLVAVLGGQNYNGGIYTSTNAGAAWTLTGAPTEAWRCVASSADGSRLVAGMYKYPVSGIFINGTYNTPIAGGPQGSSTSFEYLGNSQWGAQSLLQSAGNSPNTAVTRDASGNFSAGVITATLAGNAATATTAISAATATNFSGTLAGDVTGTQGATVVSSVQGMAAATLTNGATLANAATSANTANTLVKRDASGNFSAGTLTANLVGNATLATNVASGVRVTNAFLTNAVITNSVFSGNGSGLTNVALLAGGNTFNGSQLVTNGSIGINTTTPTGKLQVNGGVAITGASSPYAAGTAGLFMEYSGIAALYGYDYGASAPKNLILQSPGGSVGIGTISPAHTLHVTGSIATRSSTATDGYLDLQPGSSTTQGFIEWFKPGPTRIGYLGFGNGGVNNLGLNLENSANFVINGGSMGIGMGTASPSQALDITGSEHLTANIYVDGYIYNKWSGAYLSLNGGGNGNGATVTWSSSDARLKKDVAQIENALGTLGRLRGVTYHWNETGLAHLTRDIESKWRSASGTDEDNKKLWAEKRQEAFKTLKQQQTGFIAQELEEVFPSWVRTDEKGFKQINVEQLTGVIVQAVNELNQKNEKESQAREAEIQALKKEVAERAAVNQRMEERLGELEKAVASLANHSGTALAMRREIIDGK